MTLVCGACGATNPDRASWCNQCLSDLQGAAPARVTRVAQPAPNGRVTTDDRRIRSGDAGVEWACESCGGWSPLDARVCVTCGTPSPLTGAGERSAVAGVPAKRILLLNALAPGVGHLVAGWIGSGLARLVLFAVWAVGGMLLLLGGGLPVALPLLLGAAILWGVGLPDAVRAAEERPQLLTGRVLLWLVIGVTLLSALAAAAAVAGAGG